MVPEGTAHVGCVVEATVGTLGFKQPIHPDIVTTKVQVLKLPFVSVTVMVMVSGPFPNVLNRVPGAGL